MKTAAVAHEEKSDLVKAIEARERKAFIFDIADGLGGIKIASGKYAMRVLTCAEQDIAGLGVDQYIDEWKRSAKSKDLSSTLLEDVIGNARIAYLMHAACRRVGSDGVPQNMPAFPSGRWLLENLTTDELAVLLHHYNEVLRFTGPIDLDLDDNKIEGLAVMTARHADTDAPNLAFVVFSHEQLGEIAIRFALKLREARVRIAEFEARVAELEAGDIQPAPAPIVVTVHEDVEADAST